MRLAQSIGLHEDLGNINPGSGDSSTENYQRSRIWYVYRQVRRVDPSKLKTSRWMLVWQDTFLSFTYDRPLSTFKYKRIVPHDIDSSTGNSFAESIFMLCQVLIDRTNQESSNAMPATLTYKKRVEAIWDSTKPSLKHKSLCRTLQDHLERLALRIHLKYSITRLCRLALEPCSAADTSELNVVDSNCLMNECAEHAADTVESFLELHRLAATVCRSSAFVHNAVSCACTLRTPDFRLSRFSCCHNPPANLSIFQIPHFPSSLILSSIEITFILSVVQGP